MIRTGAPHPAMQRSFSSFFPSFCLPCFVFVFLSFPFRFRFSSVAIPFLTLFFQAAVPKLL